MQCEAAKENARFRALQLAELQANHFEALFHSFDIALMRFRDYFQSHSRTETIKDIQKLQEELPENANAHMEVINQKGFLIFSTAYPSGLQNKRLYMGNQALFKAHFGATQDKRYIGGPTIFASSEIPNLVNLSPDFAKWRFCRRCRHQHLCQILVGGFGRLKMAEKDIGALFTQNGTFLARSIAWERAIGTQVPTKRPFLSPRSELNGTYHVYGQVITS